MLGASTFSWQGNAAVATTAACEISHSNHCQTNLKAHDQHHVLAIVGTWGEVVETEVQEALVGSPRPPGPSTGPEPSSSKSSSSLNHSSSSWWRKQSSTCSDLCELNKWKCSLWPHHIVVILTSSSCLSSLLNLPACGPGAPALSKEFTGSRLLRSLEWRKWKTLQMEARLSNQDP